jgi:hypothetical protein
MQLTFHAFETDTPQRTLYQQGVDFLAHEYDVSPEEAYNFIEKLNDPRDSFYLHDPEGYLLLVWKKEDQSLWVEIQGMDFWTISEVSLDALKAILDMVARREKFSDYIPTTGHIWDAYGFMGDEH